MKTIDIQMDITYDAKEKKITSIRPFAGNLSLPGQCVVCHQPSTKEVTLLLDIEGLGAAYEYPQPMPYCQKHKMQLALIRLLNVLPAIFTIGLTVYLFIYLGGWGGDGTRSMSSGIFLAFFLGAVLFFFLKPKIKSLRNGTSGTGVRIVRNNPSKEFSVEENPTILRFRFINDEFAMAIARLNPKISYVVDDETSIPPA
jgi:hypothetical protein